MTLTWANSVFQEKVSNKGYVQKDVFVCINMWPDLYRLALLLL